MSADGNVSAPWKSIATDWTPFRKGWWLVAAAILTVACNGQPPKASVPPDAPARDLHIDGIDILTDDKGFVVLYSTRTSVRDCQAQAAELPLVWEKIVRLRLKDAAVHEVTLFPEDSSGLSVSFTFTKDSSGEWKVPAPCSVSIPAGDSDRSESVGQLAATVRG